MRPNAKQFGRDMKYGWSRPRLRSNPQAKEKFGKETKRQRKSNREKTRGSAGISMGSEEDSSGSNLEQHSLISQAFLLAWPV